MKRIARGLGCLLLFAFVQFCDFAELDSSASADTETSLAALPLYVDFEANGTGPYAHEMIRHDWKGLLWENASRDGRANITTDDGNKVLRISYPEGGVRPKDSGGQFVVNLPTTNELWLSYRFKFEEGFDFKWGGKLPGLTSGGSFYTGGNIPVTGDGWSARFMWRNSKSYSDGLYIYAYYVGQENTQWGDSIPLDDRVAKIVPGQWHRLTQRIKLNDSDQSNGEIDVWFDDEIAYSSSSFRWREGEEGMIDAFYFSTFHGGQSSDWAPEVDSFCRFDDFWVSREPPVFIAGK